MFVGNANVMLLVVVMILLVEEWWLWKVYVVVFDGFWLVLHQTVEWKKLLDRLGFQWTIPVITAAWMSSYNEVRAYKARHGHLQVRTSPSPLGKWISHQHGYQRMITIYQKRRSHLHNLASRRGARFPLAPVTLLLLKSPKLRALAIPWKRELHWLDQRIGTRSVNERIGTSVHQQSGRRLALLVLLGYGRMCAYQLRHTRIDPAWMAWYSKAEEFYTWHDGHLKVPSRTPLENWQNR
jgi:hypothetical protein